MTIFCKYIKIRKLPVRVHSEQRTAPGIESELTYTVTSKDQMGLHICKAINCNRKKPVRAVKLL